MNLKVDFGNKIKGLNFHSLFFFFRIGCLNFHFVFFRDLAARNCLVMSDLSLKIGDYGIAEDLFKVSATVPVRLASY